MLKVKFIVAAIIFFCSAPSLIALNESQSSPSLKTTPPTLLSSASASSLSAMSLSSSSSPSSVISTNPSLTDSGSFSQPLRKGDGGTIRITMSSWNGLIASCSELNKQLLAVKSEIAATSAAAKQQQQTYQELLKFIASQPSAPTILADMQKASLSENAQSIFKASMNEAQVNTLTSSSITTSSDSIASILTISPLNSASSSISPDGIEQK